jgi:hypothetical protein
MARFPFGRGFMTGYMVGSSENNSGNSSGGSGGGRDGCLSALVAVGLLLLLAGAPPDSVAAVLALPALFLIVHWRSMN